MKTVAPLASGLVAAVLLMQANPRESDSIDKNVVAKYEGVGAEYGRWNYTAMSDFGFQPE